MRKVSPCGNTTSETEAKHQLQANLLGDRSPTSPSAPVAIVFKGRGDQNGRACRIPPLLFRKLACKIPPGAEMCSVYTKTTTKRKPNIQKHQTARTPMPDAYPADIKSVVKANNTWDKPNRGTTVQWKERYKQPRFVVLQEHSPLLSLPPLSKV